jgi:hypothetical protein
MTAAALKTTGSLVSDNHQLRSPGEGARLGSAGLPYELLAGFDKLARSRPLWVIEQAAWDAVVESALARRPLGIASSLSRPILSQYLS